LRIDLLNAICVSSPAPRSRIPEGRPRSRSESDESAREHWRIARALRTGALVADRVFDEIFPPAARARSSVYWTPVEVAVRAANMLADRAGATILDIGSGVGKFCIVAAAAVNAHAHGIEHRPHLVDIAREAAAKIGVSPTFDGGTIEEQDAASIDGFYLYNPFAENLCQGMDRLDNTVELSAQRFSRDIEATELLLSRARVGARVVTYCGFGGDMPEDFARAGQELRGGGRLELWVKQHPTRP
jgi:SAM-dependent methyltransferase